MKLFDLKNAAAASLLLGCIPAAFAQGAGEKPSPTPPPSSIQFPSAVELVTVDAVVTDKKNLPIEGLTRDSFQVFEDGKPQSVASFEAVVLPAAPPSGPRKLRKISTNQGAEVRTGRTFIIVFDDVHLQPFQANRAKAAVDQFLKTGTRDGDRVTLLASGGGAWWSTRMPEGYGELTALLKRLDGRDIPDTGQDRVTDWEALRIQIYRDKQVEERVARRFETYGVNPGGQRGQDQSSPSGQNFDGDPLVQGRAAEVYYQATAKNKITLNAVERALSSLAGAKGRKSLILVGQGFIFDPNLDEFKNVIQASRRGNCAIYFVDTMGLGGLPVAMTAQFGPALEGQDIGAAFAENLERSEGAESIAADSGGFSVKNSNDLAKGLQRIADETRAYYLIGYNPTNTARDGKFRKIEVKVAGKDLKVRARKGYFASLDGAPKDSKKKVENAPDNQFQEALDSPFEMTDVPLRLTSYVFDETLLGKASTVIHLDVDLSSFAFNEKEGRYTDSLDFLLVVAHRETGEFNRYDQTINMSLRPETRDKYRASWFPIQRDFELMPGAYQAKVVVRDKNGSKLGTVIHDFEVPELASWRLSTPILTDTIQPAAKGQENAPPKLVMLARRDFETGARIFCQFDVYNPTKDKATGMPKVTAGYTIRKKSDGMVFLKVAPTMIQPTSLGRLSRMIGPPLEGAEPGEYEFELNLKDELNGKIMDYKEEFTVLPKGANASATASKGN